MSEDGSRPSWYDQRHRDVAPLVSQCRSTTCSFTFGPSEPSVSTESYDYPAGISLHVLLLDFSRVEHEAPGLFCRPGFMILGAVPNLLRREIYFAALVAESFQIFYVFATAASKKILMTYDSRWRLCLVLSFI